MKKERGGRGGRRETFMYTITGKPYCSLYFTEVEEAFLLYRLIIDEAGIKLRELAPNRQNQT